MLPGGVATVPHRLRGVCRKNTRRADGVLFIRAAADPNEAIFTHRKFYL